MSGIFRTVGPLPEEESHLYVERVEDREIVSEVRRGNYVTLIGARQMGKTSLLWRLRRELLGDGHIPVYLDVSPARDREQEAWYRYFHSLLREQLERDIPDITVPVMRDHVEFHEALRQVSRQIAGSRKVILLLDEVSAVPPDISDLFFSTVRTVFNEREPFPELRRCVFVMAGTFIPSQLVRDPTISPFNIASRIYASDATREGLAKLIKNLERAGCSVSSEIVGQIYRWTHGHLYLTQCLCDRLERRADGRLSTQHVDSAADDAVSDRNVGRIYRELDKLPEAKQCLQRVLAGNRPPRFNRASSLIAELELIGVIKKGSDGYCRLRNDIYRKALGEKYPDLRTDAVGELTELEHKLHEYFCKNINRTCPKHEIAVRVWGKGADRLRGIDDRIFRLVARLREKLDSDPASTLDIVTVRGRGYMPRRRH